MKFIQSSENPLFRRLLALRDSGRERREEGATLIEGAHLIDAYIENHGKVPGMIVLDEHSLERSDLRDLVARVPGAPLVTFRSNLFSKISPVAGGNAVLAVIPIGETSLAETLAAGAFQLWLDGVQDPGNVGSIIRSAAASGAKAIVLGPGCADPWSPKCLRAGMGGQFA
ncbi:MAG: TrmH family RNA methyltransferase, partial [Betaproteobacteria bacterium]